MTLVGIRRGGRQIKAVQERRDVNISTSMRLEDLVHQLCRASDQFKKIRDAERSKS